jgi:phage shock protein A
MMAESVLKRVQRVVSAGVETAVDAAERLSGASLMREAVREVDRNIEKLTADRLTAKTKRLQAEHQQKACRDLLAGLDEQGRFALQKGRDDLAQVAVLRQLDLEDQIARLTAFSREKANEEKAFDAAIAALRLRKTKMEAELGSLEAARNAASTAAGAGGARLDRKVALAEAAFDRGMAAAGGIAGVRTAVHVAEIDELQKQQLVADRLAELRGAAGVDEPTRSKSKASRRKAGR